MKYRKKAGEEAIQYTFKNILEIISFLGYEPEILQGLHENSHALLIEDFESVVSCVSKNDWIIKKSNGKFDVCSPEIFEQTYEKIEEEQQEKKIYTWEDPLIIKNNTISINEACEKYSVDSFLILDNGDINAWKLEGRY
jgi:hypothetical protein